MSRVKNPSLGSDKDLSTTIDLVIKAQTGGKGGTKDKGEKKEGGKSSYSPDFESLAIEVPNFDM